MQLVSWSLRGSTQKMGSSNMKVWNFSQNRVSWPNDLKLDNFKMALTGLSQSDFSSHGEK